MSVGLFYSDTISLDDDDDGDDIDRRQAALKQHSKLNESGATPLTWVETPICID